MTQAEIVEIACDYANVSQYNKPYNPMRLKDYEGLLRWVLMTHCIASKKKIREIYNNHLTTSKSHPRLYERNSSKAVVKALEDLFDDSIFK